MQAEEINTIDAVDIEQEILMVRSKELGDLVGTTSFTAALYHILTGQLPDADTNSNINRFMVNCLRETLTLKNQYKQLPGMISTECELESLLMIALLLFDRVAKEKAQKLIPVQLFELEKEAEGLFLMAILPSVICLALTNLPEHDFYNLIQECCGRYSDDFTALTLALFRCGKTSSLEDIALMNSLLICLHAGFGIITPTIALARFSASTRASIAKNIVAGFTGCGPAHVGACKAAMALFNKLKDMDASFSDSKIREIFCTTKPIPGFGHPLLNCDPRNEMLSTLVQNTEGIFTYFTAYQRVVSIVMQDYQLQPNIDLIAAAILLDLCLDSTLGTAVFLFARIPTIIAHAIEKQKAPPFGISKKDAREHFSVVPKRWI